MTLRGRCLIRTFHAAFDALRDHDKEHQAEVALIVDGIIRHLRSWKPAQVSCPLPEQML